MLYERVNKALNWGVKLASLAVTGPATWMVATDLFGDIQQPTILFVMRFSAVFLIEGVMLSNWLPLEFDKHATPEIKGTVWVDRLAMYVALLVIGWRHEGPTGLVFPHRALARRCAQEVTYQIANPKIADVCDLMRDLLAEEASHRSQLARSMADI